MRFTELLKELQATYPEQPRAFHVIATRFYLGVESLQELRLRAQSYPVFRTHYGQPVLSEQQVQAIIDNR